MNDMEQNGGIEISLQRLLWAVLEKLWLLVLAAALGVGIALSVGYCFVTPQYQSSVVLYVNNAQERNVYAGDLTTSRNLVDSILVILKTRQTMLDVISYSDADHSLPELEKMISATAVNNTEFFRITVTSPDVYEAETIANAIGSILPRHISDVLEGTSAKVVDPAVIAAKPSTPNYGQYALLGGVCGLGLALVILLLSVLFDDTIRSGEELLRVSPVPVLAKVPGEAGWRRLERKLEILLPEPGRIIGILGSAQSLENALADRGRSVLVLRNGGFGHQDCRGYEDILLELPTVEDALEASGKADGFLILVRQNHCTVAGLRDMVDQLNFSGERILGILYEENKR